MARIRSRGPIAAEAKVSSWEHLRRLSRALHGWMFRGQSSARHDLSSSLERAARRSKFRLEWLQGTEQAVIQAFQRRAHHYLSAVPSPTPSMEWLALLQHHGAPTRLLDFTESVYVAAFFACEFADGDAAIWAINTPAVRGVLAKKAGISTKDLAVAVFEFEGRSVSLCEEAMQTDKPRPGVIPVQPWTLNQRISLQQGMFLCPLDVTKPFEVNLAATLACSPGLIKKLPRLSIDRRAKAEEIAAALTRHLLLKFILPADRVMRVQDDLARMNVSATTLFPGLDGFARSLHHMVGMQSVYDYQEDD